MHLSKVNEVLDHKIVGGSEFQWQCWENARYLDFESDYAHASVVFNSKTQEIYVAEVNDKDDVQKPYRWLNPVFKQAYIAEAKERNVNPDQAWDDKKWFDLETQEDWLEKAGAIMRNEEFDTRIQVPIDLEKDELYTLMKMAHDRDITLNEMVEEVLWEVIKRNE